MAPERVSTTVDGDLVAEARARQAGLNDSALFDAALAALVRAGRAAEIDAAYAAYAVVLQPDEDPVPRRSAVNLDSVASVSIAVVVERLGRLSDRRMDQVCGALAVAADCQR